MSLANPRAPLWALGFRPFFLLAAAAAALLVALWMFVYTGFLPPPPFFTAPLYWHAHEMIFGFAAAAIVGFLMTASQNWSGIRGIHGARLETLAVVWLLGRLLPWVPMVPHWLYSLVDLSFLPAAAVLLAPYLGRKGRNAGLLGLLTLLTIGNLLVHLDAAGILPGLSHRGLLLGLDTILWVIIVIGGRIIPAFTRNAVPHANVRSYRWLDLLALASVGLYLILNFFFETSVVTALVAAAAAVINGARLALWSPWQMRHNPMLAILGAGYSWMTLGFALTACSHWHPLPSDVPLHAFAVGGIGCMIYGVMPRVSMGHTGRRIQASRWLAAGFVLVNLAAILRVLSGALPELRTNVLVSAATVWVIAFTMFLVMFWPILTRPRLDGRPG